MSDPIEEPHIALMNDLANMLDKCFTGYGFCLLVFDFNRHDGRMNYISNAKREDMLVALKEFIANHEGRVMPAARA